MTIVSVVGDAKQFILSTVYRFTKVSLFSWMLLVYVTSSMMINSSFIWPLLTANYII